MTDPSTGPTAGSGSQASLGRIAPSFDVSVRAAGRWFIVGGAAVGFALGWFVGMSSTPVVGVLLPLLLAGIGGGSGVLMARTPLDGATAVWRLRCVGLATLVFAVLAVVGALVGVSIRHGYMPVPGWSEPDVAAAEAVPLDLELLPVATQVQLLVLREHLELMGVLDAERDAVLDAAVEQCKAAATWSAEGDVDRRRLVGELRRLSGWAVGAAKDVEEEGELRSFLSQFAGKLAAAATTLEESAQDGEGGSVRQALYAYAAEQADSALGELEYEAPGEVEELLLGDDVARRALAILQGHESAYVSGPQEELDVALSTLERQIQLRVLTGEVLFEAASGPGLARARRGIASSDPPVGVGTVDG